jgi:DNA polymerase III delta prime subunit
MKKIVPISFIGLLAFSSIAVACNNNCQDNKNVVQYATQAETTVKSNSVLVQVTGYATTTLENQNIVEKQITDQVNNIVKADWKVKNLEQNTSNSGALNITLQLQARISKQELNKLQSALDNQKASGKKLIVEVLDYNPPAVEVELAKQELMIRIFKDTKKYLDEFNKETDSDYTIQSIKYTDFNNYYRPRNNVMLMKASSNEMDSASQSSVAISQDITIKANVTFMEK